MAASCLEELRLMRAASRGKNESCGSVSLQGSLENTVGSWLWLQSCSRRQQIAVDS